MEKRTAMIKAAADLARTAGALGRMASQLLAELEDNDAIAYSVQARAIDAHWLAQLCVRAAEELDAARRA